MQCASMVMIFICGYKNIWNVAECKARHLVCLFRKNPFRYFVLNKYLPILSDEWRRTLRKYGTLSEIKVKPYSHLTDFF